MAGAAAEAVAAEMGLVEAEPLDLRAHGAVEDEDALARGLRQRGEYLGPAGGFGDGPEQGIKRIHLRQFQFPERLLVT